MEIQDTIHLLSECNAGIKMGVSSIDEAMPAVESPHLRQILTSSKQAHQQLGSETHRMLTLRHADGKDPNPIAQGMSWIKTNVMLAVDPADGTVASLITDGCQWGSNLCPNTSISIPRQTPMPRASPIA